MCNRYSDNVGTKGVWGHASLWKLLYLSLYKFMLSVCLYGTSKMLNTSISGVTMKKAHGILNFLRRNISKCSAISIETAYNKGMVRPHVEYASSTWDSHIHKVSQKEFIERQSDFTGHNQSHSTRCTDPPKVPGVFLTCSQGARWSRDSRLLEWIFTLRSHYWLISSDHYDTQRCIILGL